MSKKPKVIILGAGMSGMTCRNALTQKFDVSLYEKSRVVVDRLTAKKSLMEVIGLKVEPIDSQIFKWKYARCITSNSIKKFLNIPNDVYAIRDWNISPRIASSFLSGLSLSKFLNSNLK